MDTPQEKKRSLLSTHEWLGIIAVIATASAGNIIGQYRLVAGLRAEMVQLDERWQLRTESLAYELRAELKEIRQAMTDATRQTVQRLEQRIKVLEAEKARGVNFQSILAPLDGSLLSPLDELDRSTD